MSDQVQKSNIKIVERGKTNDPLTHKYMTAHLYSLIQALQ